MPFKVILRSTITLWGIAVNIAPQSDLGAASTFPRRVGTWFTKSTDLVTGGAISLKRDLDMSISAISILPYELGGAHSGL